jgi:hypothetical protein
VSIADTPTMIMLDYRECGRQGEPRVVYVDQEDDYSMTLPDFATFIQGPGHQDAGFGRSFEPFCWRDRISACAAHRLRWAPVTKRGLSIFRPLLSMAISVRPTSMPTTAAAGMTVGAVPTFPHRLRRDSPRRTSRRRLGQRDRFEVSGHLLMNDNRPLPERPVCKKSGMCAPTVRLRASPMTFRQPRFFWLPTSLIW